MINPNMKICSKCKETAKQIFKEIDNEFFNLITDEAYDHETYDKLKKKYGISLKR